jgi:hypothetical protein
MLIFIFGANHPLAITTLTAAFSSFILWKTSSPVVLGRRISSSTASMRGL